MPVYPYSTQSRQYLLQDHAHLMRFRARIGIHKHPPRRSTGLPSGTVTCSNTAKIFRNFRNSGFGSWRIYHRVSAAVRFRLGHAPVSHAPVSQYRQSRRAPVATEHDVEIGRTEIAIQRVHRKAPDCCSASSSAERQGSPVTRASLDSACAPRLRWLATSVAGTLQPDALGGCCRNELIYASPTSLN